MWQEIGLKIAIITISIAPVGIVFPSNAMAVFPCAKVSLIILE